MHRLAPIARVGTEQVVADAAPVLCNSGLHRAHRPEAEVVGVVARPDAMQPDLVETEADEVTARPRHVAERRLAPVIAPDHVAEVDRDALLPVAVDIVDRTTSPIEDRCVAATPRPPLVPRDSRLLLGARCGVTTPCERMLPSLVHASTGCVLACVGVRDRRFVADDRHQRVEVVSFHFP